jgi:probable F420-dependent oxidoreductase
MTGVGLCLPQLGEHVTLEVVRGFCQRAESLGYSSIWVQDHFMWPLNPERGYAGRDGATIPVQYQSVLAPLELLAGAAAWTESMRLGTSILVAGNHSPVQLAQRLATIDLLSGGRLLVGLGVGWSAEEHRQSNTDITTRGERIEEFLDVLLACWGPDPVEYHGRFFDIDPTIQRPKPARRPALLSGMWSAAGLDRTRRRFDGWNPAGLPVERVAETVAAMNAERPSELAPLRVFHRVFAQYPKAPTPEGDVVARLCEEAAHAARHGFEEIVIEHNFWDGISSPADWLAVPGHFADVVTAAQG